MFYSNGLGFASGTQCKGDASDTCNVIGAGQHSVGAHETFIQVEQLQKGLCGVSRPHFFRGVATVSLSAHAVTARHCSALRIANTVMMLDATHCIAQWHSSREYSSSEFVVAAIMAVPKMLSECNDAAQLPLQLQENKNI